MLQSSGPRRAVDDCRPLMLLLDEDGEAPNDAKRARKRYPSIGVGPRRHERDPRTARSQTRATLDAVLAKWAA
jgi:hypothetical protein